LHDSQEKVTLANSLSLRVRAVRTIYKRKLLDGFRTLSSESRYRRFLAQELAEPERTTLFHRVDGMHHFALAAIELSGQGKEDDIVGVARFIRVLDDAAVGSCALRC
jgi:hypothetical protein